MALSYSKPIKRPDWGDTSTNIVEPSAGFKDDGWLVNAVHPSSYENWRANTVSNWFKWFDERFDDGATKDDLLLNTTLELDASSHSLGNVSWVIKAIGVGDTSGTGNGGVFLGDGSTLSGSTISRRNGLIAAGGGAGAVVFGGTSVGVFGIGGKDSSGDGSWGGAFVGGVGINAGQGIVVNGTQPTGTNKGSDGINSVGGQGGTNNPGGFGIRGIGGPDGGSSFNGIGIVGVGGRGVFSTTTTTQAGAGIYGLGHFRIGTFGAGGEGGIFDGKSASVSGDGGHGIIGTGGAEAGGSNDGLGIVGLGYGASVTFTSSSSGTGIQGIGSTSGGYGGWFTGGLNTSPLHLTPQNADPSTAITGDLMVTSSSHTDGAGYLKIYITGTGWVKVGTQT